MIGALIEAHRRAVLEDEANFDATGKAVDALAARASEAAERTAFTDLAKARCTSDEEVQAKVRYFATGTVGERSTLTAYLLEHSDGDFSLLQQFVASLSLKNEKGPASVGALPDQGSTIPGKEKEMNKTTDTTAPAARPYLPGENQRGVASYAVSNLASLFTVCAAALTDVDSWSDPVREKITSDVTHVLELGALLASDVCEAVEKLES